MATFGVKFLDTISKSKTQDFERVVLKTGVRGEKPLGARREPTTNSTHI